MKILKPLIEAYRALMQTLNLIRGDLHFLIVDLRDIEARIASLEASVRSTADNTDYLARAGRHARVSSGRMTDL